MFQRKGAEHFDKGGGAQLFRISAENWIAGDPPCEDASPHILAVLVDRYCSNLQSIKCVVVLRTPLMLLLHLNVVVFSHAEIFFDSLSVCL